MDSFEFNSVKAEKAQAIRSYNIQKMLKKLELLTAFALLAWSSYNYIPTAAAAKHPADFFRQNVAVFGHPLYVFIAINILIIVIFVLSSSSSSSQKPSKQDLYDDYVTITNAARRSSTPADDDKTAPEAEVPVSEKQIVSVDNAVSSPAAKAIITTTTTTTTAAVVKDCEPVCLVQKSEPVWPVQEGEPIATVTEVKEYYRRTQSDRFDRGKGNNRELIRRSETLIKRTTEVKMDDLSSEEFRLTIETFIADTKKTFIADRNTLDLNLASQKKLY